MSQTSLALRNMRGYLILIVVAFHSSLAYLASNPAEQPLFDAPPYAWKGTPIIDSDRWIGFDLFVAWQYVYMMQFMFFLSGLFVWPSLVRKGARKFLSDRLLRLGVPFLIGVYVLIPLAHYPVYAVSVANPSWTEFPSAWLSLPLWPSGPLWFLWFLLMLNIMAATLFFFVPEAGEFLARLTGSAKEHPTTCFAKLLAASALAYLPLSLFFRPWDMTQVGPFIFQSSFVLLYVVYFVFGIAVGTFGLERGLLDADGKLARNWIIWTLTAVFSFVLWLIPMALSRAASSVLGLQLLADVAFVLASTTSCFALPTVFLHFRPHSRVLLELSRYAYGIYYFHYLFVVWLQYFFLHLSAPGVLKGVLVFLLSLMLSWATAKAVDGVVGLIKGNTDLRPLSSKRVER